MSDFLPVRMQDFLYRGKPELRERKQIIQEIQHFEADRRRPLWSRIVGVFSLSAYPYVGRQRIR